jgi:trehalose/maltose transport system substrate-binding protein
MQRCFQIAAVAFLSMLTVAGAASVRSETIVISCGAVGKELMLCRSGAGTWSRRSGHNVQVVTAPSSTNARLALYQQLLAAQSADVDVFQIDVIWPGILGDHLMDVTPYLKEEDTGHFPALITNNRVDGRLTALPWFTSAGLLYYRKDLLEKYGENVPVTWKSLTRVARRIQQAERAAGHQKLWGFVWQGRAYEGLTCNALEWIAAHGGGTLIEADGRVTLDNPRAAAALALAAAWVGDISPPGILNYAEEEARGVFQSGNAIFMRNWPYAWALAQAEDSPVRNKVGVAPLPKGGPGGRRASTLGGWQLAVSRYSTHPGPAVDLVRFLTSAGEQKRRALAGSFNPSRPALYRDPEVLAANPFMDFLGESLEKAVVRPSAVCGSRYNRVSSRIWNAVHSALAGKTPPGPTLGRLSRELKRILHRRRR